MDNGGLSYYRRYIYDIIIIFYQNKINEQLITNYMNNVNKYLEFKREGRIKQQHNNITYWDLSIHRNNNDQHLGTHRKPTKTDTTVQFTSNYPLEHKLTAYNFYMNRMTTLPIMEQAKQKEWDVIHTVAKTNGFPVQIIHTSKNKIILKTQKTTVTPTQTHQKKKLVTFTYHSQLIHKFTNLLKNTYLNISFRTNSTTYNQLRDRMSLNKVNSNGVYKLKRKTCKNSCVGQTGRSIGIRHREHTKYI
jgi:hypothetical protein